MYKLLLINPKEKKSGLGSYKSTSVPPLGLGYIAALTPRQRYHVTIVDENIDILENYDADLVGITAYSAHARKAYEIAGQFRKRSIPVVMGGIHASMLPDEALAHCSSVVVGEAENVWKDVLEDFESNRLRRMYNGSPADLSSIPFPRRDLFRGNRYLWDSILTSKGCPMNCSFCSVTKFNGHRFRRRPVEQVVDELKTIDKKLVLFLDDNLLGHDKGRWLYKFFNAVIDAGIKKYFFAQTSLNFGEDQELLKLAYKAGLRLALIGIESVNPKSLISFNKSLNSKYLETRKYKRLIGNVRKAGIAVLGCFILGGDEDTIHSFQDTLEFVQETKIDILQITKPTPLPGTRFYELLSAAGRIMDTNYPEAWKNYRFSRMLFKPKQMSIEDVYAGYFYIRRQYYAIPEILKRLLSTLIDTKSLSTTLISAFFNHTYRHAFIDSDIYENFTDKSLERFIRKN
jgi:radical SAM superfamily enzyme YgiQ (UPF0313 family)